MTDDTTPASDVLEAIRNHSEIPAITTEHTILHYNGHAFIIHQPGEVTCVGVNRLDKGEVHINSIVRVTHTRPDITPADNVYSLGKTTYIDHGPGRQTRVINTEL